MQGLSGSFGIVLAVPVTVALAVLLYTAPRQTSGGATQKIHKENG